MMMLDQQLHGYRQGHQLLSASLKLPKSDQDLVDRLSDVAGPLRPGEHFEPYLTCYPLQSGSHYVLARTWQDFNAPRAGCVRTRSLIVPMAEWMAGVDIVGLIETLSQIGPSAPVERIQADRAPHSFQHVEISPVMELTEALFLEDRKPIVVFDAPEPEGITFRLLTAFWPSFRRNFAVSTFALSPRTISGRSFDLVFAPKDARSRFSDWAGRRIDARKQTGARHRWTNEIVGRVFSGAKPLPLYDETLGELSSESGGAEAEFRISLLWNELYERLEASPNAALGLLDIANSRQTRNLSAIKRLEPELGRAAQRAASTLPPSEAWRFLLALIDKLRDVRLQLSVAKAIRGAATHLARRSPIDAILNVEMLASARGHQLLLGAVGDGVAQEFDSGSAAALLELDPENFLQLLLLSPALAEATLPLYPTLSLRLADALGEAPVEIRTEAKRRLLRLLIDEQHADAARSLIADLSYDELLAETRLLATANDFAAESLRGQLIDRTRIIEASAGVRDTVASFPASRGTDAMLHRLVAPVREDVQWILETHLLVGERPLGLLRQLLQAASDEQIPSMLADGLLKPALELLMQDPAGSLVVVDRVLAHGKVDASIAIDVTMRLLPHADIDRAHDLASRALEIVLSQDIDIDRDAALNRFLGAAGAGLDGSRAIRAGLGRGVSSEVVAANLSVFNRSSPVVRRRIMSAIEDLARAIVDRGRIDYPESAVADAASLLWDSAALDQQAFVRSSAILCPFLLRAQHEPASPLIAAAFPSVYDELKKSDDVPDLFKLFLFVDWDKCKVARRDLVDAFMHSNWRATDIALAAARAGDIGRILGRIAIQDGGARVIADIRNNLSSIPEPWRDQVRDALKT
jgi:hypothetical protein